jgi:hypothetical protein
MEPVFIDLHIHTSNNPDHLKDSYDLDLLEEKIEEIAEGSTYLISFIDHNTINYSWDTTLWSYTNHHSKES